MELRGVRWLINHAYGEAALRPSRRKRKPTRGGLWMKKGETEAGRKSDAVENGEQWL